MIACSKSEFQPFVALANTNLSHSYLFESDWGHNQRNGQGLLGIQEAVLRLWFHTCVVP